MTKLAKNKRGAIICHVPQYSMLTLCTDSDWGAGLKWDTSLNAT